MYFIKRFNQLEFFSYDNRKSTPVFMQHTLIFKRENFNVTELNEIQTSSFLQMLCPNLKSYTHIWQMKTSYYSTVLQGLTNCGETRNMRIVCVSEKCHLLQESELITRVTVRLRYVSEFRAQKGVGKSASLTNCSAENIK